MSYDYIKQTIAFIVTGANPTVCVVRRLFSSSLTTAIKSHLLFEEQKKCIDLMMCNLSLNVY